MAQKVSILSMVTKVVETELGFKPRCLILEPELFINKLVINTFPEQFSFFLDLLEFVCM